MLIDFRMYTSNFKEFTFIISLRQFLFCEHSVYYKFVQICLVFNFNSILTVMLLFSLLQGKNVVSKEEIEDGFDGNICRCTG